MFSRTHDKNRSGKYCETMALSAFIADGFGIAVPYGNQRGWDLLVKSPDGRWCEVQVKIATIGRTAGARVALTRGSASRRTIGYTQSDCDLIVAVLPETGAIWKIPISAASGKRSVALTKEHLWVGDQPRSLLPDTPTIQYTPKNSKLRAMLRQVRIPAERPDKISERSWDFFLKFASGCSESAIAQQYALDPSSVHERLSRVFAHLSSL